MFKKIGLFLIVTLTLLTLVGCVSSSAEVVEIGTDTIPSLYSAVGERKITGTEKSSGTDGKELRLAYAPGISTEDIIAYMKKLEENGFIVTMDTQVQGDVEINQMSAPSVQEGLVLVVEIYFSQTDSTVISYNLIEGTITHYN